MISRRFTVFGLFAAFLVARGVSVARADVLEPMVTAGDLNIYLGLMPAQVVGEHPAGQSEAAMHGGASRGSRSKHIVVAIFEASGQRLTGASVTATISEIGHVESRRLRLETMRIADTITYGGFVTLSERARETIVIEVSRGPGTPTIAAQFTYVPDGGR